MQVYLINGFLGSGKTTAIAHACRLLIQHGKSVAVITNDQGLQQVDYDYLKSLQLPVGKVADGCFCCRYDVLTREMDALQESNKPEVIFAESVGSCADLVATVIKPLEQYYSHIKTVICAFADACLLHSLMNGTSSFINEDVQYIFRKQLEEADIIVMNKADLLNDEDLRFVKELLAKDYPAAQLISQDSNKARDINDWLLVLQNFMAPAKRKSPDIDYDRYGSGEAMLGWLDMKLSFHSMVGHANKASLLLAATIDQKIRTAGYTVGHLKFLIEDGVQALKLSYTTTDIKPVTDQLLSRESKHANMLINARVQVNPAVLLEIVEQSIVEVMADSGCRIVKHEASSFAPSYPTPVHRLA